MAHSMDRKVWPTTKVIRRLVKVLMAVPAVRVSLQRQSTMQQQHNTICQAIFRIILDARRVCRGCCDALQTTGVSTGESAQQLVGFTILLELGRREVILTVAGSLKAPAIPVVPMTKQSRLCRYR